MKGNYEDGTDITGGDQLRHNVTFEKEKNKTNQNEKHLSKPSSQSRRDVESEKRKSKISDVEDTSSVEVKVLEEISNGHKVRQISMMKQNLHQTTTDSRNEATGNYKISDMRPIDVVRTETEKVTVTENKTEENVLKHKNISATGGKVNGTSIDDNVTNSTSIQKLENHNINKKEMQENISPGLSKITRKDQKDSKTEQLNKNPSGENEHKKKTFKDGDTLILIHRKETDSASNEQRLSDTVLGPKTNLKTAKKGG